MELLDLFIFLISKEVVLGVFMSLGFGEKYDVMVGNRGYVLLYGFCRVVVVFDIIFVYF